MQKIVHLVCLGIFLNIATGVAQQVPLFTQYIYQNNAFLNPAAAGRGPFWKASLVYRHQWTGIEGTPRTGGLLVEGPIQGERAGVGAALFVDKIGFERHYGFYGNYAYRIPTGKNAWFSAGIRAGLSLYDVDFSEVRTPNPGIDDPIYAFEPQTIVPRFGTGLFWHNKRAYVGIVLPELAVIVPEKGFTFQDDQNFFSRHYLLSTGYVFDLAGKDIQLKPFVFMRYQKAAPFQLDFCAQLWFKDIVSIGAAYRLDDAFSGMVQVPFAERWNVGYAYDYTVSDLRPYAQGAHEIMLEYVFGSKSMRVPSIHKLPALRRF